MRKTIGIYAGSFNPFHVGHKNILDQAYRVFDETRIAVGINPDKTGFVKEPFPTRAVGDLIKVEYYSGLLSDHLNNVDFENEGSEVFLIRGLRNGEDLQHEQNQIQFIRDMYPSLKTVFFICDKRFEHISSSSLRALKQFSIKDYQKYTYSDL